VRSLLVAVVACLLLPAAAAAHLVIEPGLLEAGRDVDLQIEVPELRPGEPPTSLTVSGDGVRQVRSSAVGTFGRETRWEVRVHVAAAPGPTELLLTAGFADGSTVEVRRTVTVVPARSDDDGLPVAAAAFAALGLAGLVVVAVLLRRPRRTA
jgi:hypothetical protein